MSARPEINFEGLEKQIAEVERVAGELTGGMRDVIAAQRHWVMFAKATSKTKQEEVDNRGEALEAVLRDMFHMQRIF